ncbi:MAG: tripartite tricarboxylate transporter substrate-binding protein, partial [Pseudomonadota bacterium]
MIKFSTKLALLLALGLLMAFAGSAGAQQAYPVKPIRFIVPFPPGGSTDPLARLVGQKLTEAWAQQVIVENRPGGNTIIGTEALVKSPPDGY